MRHILHACGSVNSTRGSAGGDHSTVVKQPHQRHLMCPSGTARGDTSGVNGCTRRCSTTSLDESEDASESS
eukprot:696471-Alexandrium_andersonii.AAC.1